LDADGNGLYDDAERALLLKAFQKMAPEWTGPFDVDGDGRVTVLEQEPQGQHPLQMRLPSQRITASAEKIPWAIDVFPEWITTAYVQEDVPVGKVAEHSARGTRLISATQQATDRQPSKQAARGGIAFAENSGQQLSMPGYRDARWDYRWCIFTFRIDANSGSDQQTVLLDLNRGKSSNMSSPKIWYDKQAGLSIEYRGRQGSAIDQRVMTTQGVIADGTTWNVVVCGIRYGQMYASVNGVALSTATPQPPRFSGDWPRDLTSYLGDERRGNMAWAYDALVFGLTEPSEAMVRKMTGWAAHRLRVHQHLPSDHPYRTDRPVLDAEDFPYRYVHDNERWTAWGEQIKDKTITRVNAGGPRVEPEGFVRVFYDDFRANRIRASTCGEGDLWVGPGFNPAVGGSAPLITPGEKPDAYVHDAENQWQILSLVPQGKRWRGSAFYSVNDLGHGYTWTGPKIFRIRCMFPKIAAKDLPKGLFPAFWSYGIDNIMWRTANRIEVDWFEFDGSNGRWLNGMSSHYHYAYINNIFAKNPKSYQRYKVYGGELTEEKSRIPGGIEIWDGNFRTWEFVVDEEMSYANVTIVDAAGHERWVENYRFPTSAISLERLNLQLDYALKDNHNLPTDGSGKRQDFVVDWVEVLQKDSAIATLPPPFTARPRLSGSTTVGSTITCDPHLDGVTDIRYYWFADDYPLTYGPKSTFTVTAAEAGKSIRCMVKAVGYRDMPEAWSDSLR